MAGLLSILTSNFVTCMEIVKSWRLNSAQIVSVDNENVLAKSLSAGLQARLKIFNYTFSSVQIILICDSIPLTFMIVRLAITYLYHSLPKGYYLAQITELLGLHLGSSTQLHCIKMNMANPHFKKG